MIRGLITLLRTSLALVDAIGAVALFAAISSLRFGDDGWQKIWNAVGIHPLLVAGIYAVAWVVALWIHGLYGLRAFISVRRELRDIVRAMAVLALVTLSALFVLRLPDVSRLFLALLFLTQPLLTLVSRLALRLLFAWTRSRGMSARYMLVVGTGTEAQAFADRVERHRELGLRVLGHLSVPGEGEPEVSRQLLGSIDRIEDILHREVVDEVAICLPVGLWNLIEPISRICEEEGKVVRVPLDLTGFAFEGGRVEEFDGQPILSLLHGPDRVIGLAMKRLLDIGVSAIALIALSPVLAGVALAILLSDGRPVLFRQVRIGLHGRPFTVHKFRTMVPDAEELYPQLQALSDTRGPAFKMADDPRVTRLGRFLRRTSLDELPQLWNVLHGEMSIVGPRPAPPREVDGYSIWHRRRLSMKPGITGLWQIRARRPDEDFDHRAGLDLDYIDRWSLWLDLQIMARTVPVLLLGRGH
ncbi:MAG TPA: sugar transferase [Candidatus Limnocylindria bacterium]|nr:sugar transferase [Candidatus Limnocylindria bacterium]